MTAGRYTTNQELHRAVEDFFRIITPQMLLRTSQRTWRRIRLPLQHQGACNQAVRDSKELLLTRMHSAWYTVNSRPQGRPVENQAPAHWNLIGRNTTASQPTIRILTSC